MLDRATVRFLRVVLAGALAAAVQAALTRLSAPDVVDESGFLIVLTAALAALDKYARSRGWY